MKQTKYRGYRSYQYLEAGVDFRPFELVPEVDRVPSLRVGVTATQEERVQRLLDECVVVSLHDHPFVLPQNVNDLDAYRRNGRDWTGYQGLSVSGLDAVFDCLQDGTATIVSRGGWKWDDVIYDLGMRLSDIAHQNFLVVASRSRDVMRAKRNGQIAYIPSLEAATPIENELDRLDILYGFGIRSCGIAYSESNSLGTGLREDRDGGLTRFGIAAVERMNKLGIAIDVSHSGDQTSMDTIMASAKPVLITHAGARAIWDSKRMKPDEVISACAARGGVIGIEAAPHTALSRQHPRHSIESFMDHFEYCVQLVGIDHVAFGPDTMFGDHVGFHRFFTSQMSINSLYSKDDFERVEYVDGVENPAEEFPNIVRWLVGHEYSDEDIAKAIGGNVMRVWAEIEHGQIEDDDPSQELLPPSIEAPLDSRPART